MMPRDQVYRERPREKRSISAGDGNKYLNLREIRKEMARAEISGYARYTESTAWNLTTIYSSYPHYKERGKRKSFPDVYILHIRIFFSRDIFDTLGGDGGSKGQTIYIYMREQLLLRQCSKLIFCKVSRWPSPPAIVVRREDGNIKIRESRDPTKGENKMGLTRGEVYLIYGADFPRAHTHTHTYSERSQTFPFRCG